MIASLHRRLTLPIACLLTLASAATLQADNPQQTFVKAWQGRTVTVKTTLYSLIYNERGLMGTTRTGLREGLVVATPSQGSYFQFDGRQNRPEVMRRDLHRFISAVNTTYEPDELDVRQYRKLEAVAINRYDPGVVLVVSTVRISRDEVTFELSAAPGEESVTAVRIKWPLPISKRFDERPEVEDLLQQFIEVKQP